MNTTIPLGFPTWERMAILAELRRGEKRWHRRIPAEGVENYESLAAAHAMMASLYRDLRIQIVCESRNFHRK